MEESRNKRMDSPGAGSSLGCTSSCETALGKGRWTQFEDMSPAWGHQQCGCVSLPHGATPGRCSSPALIRAPQICPQLQKSHFLHSFILAQPEIRGTSSSGVGKGTNPSQEDDLAPCKCSCSSPCRDSQSWLQLMPCWGDTTVSQ